MLNESFGQLVQLGLKCQRSLSNLERNSIPEVNVTSTFAVCYGGSQKKESQAQREQLTRRGKQLTEGKTANRGYS